MLPFRDVSGGIEDVHVGLVRVVWVDDLSPHLPLRIVLVLDPFVELAGEKVRVPAGLGQGLFLGEVVLFGLDCRVGGYFDTDKVEGFPVLVLDPRWLAEYQERVGTARTGCSLVKV